MAPIAGQDPGSGIGLVQGKACAEPAAPSDWETWTLGGNALSPACVADGLNRVYARLVDNLGQAGAVAGAALYYDGQAPKAGVQAPAEAATSPIPVDFTDQDPGAGASPPTGSGIAEAWLWYRQAAGQAWQKWPDKAASGSGRFDFMPPGDGPYQFHVQAKDKAGNLAPEPGPGLAFNRMTYFATPPVITGGRVNELGILPGSALLEWATDEECSALVEYGPTPAMGRRVEVMRFALSHSAGLDNLPYPSRIYYRVTAANRAGLTAAASGDFDVPMKIELPLDASGNLDPTKPITVTADNPALGPGAYAVDGQSGALSPTSANQIYVAAGQVGAGDRTFTAGWPGFGYATEFYVDPASRNYRLARLAVSSLGSMTGLGAGQAAVELTLGQAIQGPSSDRLVPAGEQPDAMASAGHRLYLGFYAGIDPVAPDAAGSLSAEAGPGQGQARLQWIAAGDDKAAGRAMSYDLRSAAAPIATEADFQAAERLWTAALPAETGAPQELVVSGLPDGVDRYFGLKALDELGNGTLASAGVRTLSVARSAELIGDKPVVEFVSDQAGVVISLAAGPDSASALRLAAENGLVPAGLVFDLAAPGPLAKPGLLRFRYDAAGMSAELESGIRLYRFDAEAGAWVKASDAGPVVEHDVLVAEVAHLSLFALMIEDRAPPVTALAYEGGRQFVSAQGGVFVSTATGLRLAAVDPPVGPFPGTGVKLTEYRLDDPAGAFTAFEPQAPPLRLAAGMHSLQFRSVDRAGNAEPVWSVAVGVDACRILVSELCFM